MYGHNSAQVSIKVKRKNVFKLKNCVANEKCNTTWCCGQKSKSENWWEPFKATTLMVKMCKRSKSPNEKLLKWKCKNAKEMEHVQQLCNELFFSFVVVLSLTQHTSVPSMLSVGWSFVRSRVCKSIMLLYLDHLPSITSVISAVLIFYD